jgi:hypothetical protein
VDYLEKTAMLAASQPEYRGTSSVRADYYQEEEPEIGRRDDDDDDVDDMMIIIIQYNILVAQQA